MKLHKVRIYVLGGEGEVDDITYAPPKYTKIYDYVKIKLHILFTSILDIKSIVASSIYEIK